MGMLCPDCRPHDGPNSSRIIRTSLGWMFGRTVPARVIVKRPRCRDGRIRYEWPEEISRAARLPLATMVGFITDACEMSIKRAAERHGIPRGKAGQLFSIFCENFWAAYKPAVPPGFEYIGLDVGHLQGKNHLFVAALTVTGEDGSVLIVILPYTGDDDRGAARHYLRSLDGKDQIKAVACDLSTDLCSLIQEVWPHAKIVGDLHHVVNDLLLPLNEARNKENIPSKMTARGPSGQRREGIKALVESRPFRLTKNDLKRRDFYLAILGETVTTLYHLKEKILNWYKLVERAKAAKKLDEILSEIDSLSETINYISGFIYTIQVTWREHILNYFDHKITTAYVENEVKFFKLRYALWSVSGDFRQHYVRMLVRDGPMTQSMIDKIAWQTAKDFRPRLRSGRLHEQ